MSNNVCTGPDLQTYQQWAAKRKAELPSGRSEPLLSSQVARLETDRDALACLCGEVLATVRVNWDRGTLVALPTVEHPEKATEVRERFDEGLELWESRLKELRDNTERHAPSGAR